MIVFDLLIPTQWVWEGISWLVKTVAHQSVFPHRIVFLVWKEYPAVYLQEFAYQITKTLAHLESEIVILHAGYSDHEPGKGAGYDRWFLVQQATSQYSCMIDEDNELPPDFFHDLIAWYTVVTTSLGHEAIVSPTIMWRHSGQIQSQGITWFSFLFPKYTFGHCGDKPWQEVLMLWANSLFGRTELFQRIQFDPRMEGSYEDVDFTYRVMLSGASVVVLRDLEIYHMEREKTPLEQLFLGNPHSAFLRSRNRIRFVRKNATVWQKIQYFCCGLWVQTTWWIRYILRSDHPQKWSLIWAVWRGIGVWSTTY